jgi:hypothetical protein
LVAYPSTTISLSKGKDFEEPAAKPAYYRLVFFIFERRIIDKPENN